MADTQQRFLWRLKDGNGSQFIQGQAGKPFYHAPGGDFFYAREDGTITQYYHNDCLTNSSAFYPYTLIYKGVVTGIKYQNEKKIYQTKVYNTSIASSNTITRGWVQSSVPGVYVWRVNTYVPTQYDWSRYCLQPQSKDYSIVDPQNTYFYGAFNCSVSNRSIKPVHGLSFFPSTGYPKKFQSRKLQSDTNNSVCNCALKITEDMYSLQALQALKDYKEYIYTQDIIQQYKEIFLNQQKLPKKLSQMNSRTLTRLKDLLLQTQVKKYLLQDVMSGSVKHQYSYSCYRDLSVSQVYNQDQIQPKYKISIDTRSASYICFDCIHPFDRGYIYPTQKVRYSSRPLHALVREQNNKIDIQEGVYTKQQLLQKLPYIFCLSIGPFSDLSLTIPTQTCNIPDAPLVDSQKGVKFSPPYYIYKITYKLTSLKNSSSSPGFQSDYRLHYLPGYKIQNNAFIYTGELLSKIDDESSEQQYINMLAKYGHLINQLQIDKKNNCIYGYILKTDESALTHADIIKPRTITGFTFSQRYVHYTDLDAPQDTTATGATVYCLVEENKPEFALYRSTFRDDWYRVVWNTSYLFYVDSVGLQYSGLQLNKFIDRALYNVVQISTTEQTHICELPNKLLFYTIYAQYRQVNICQYLQYLGQLTDQDAAFSSSSRLVTVLSQKDCKAKTNFQYGILSFCVQLHQVPVTTISGQYVRKQRKEGVFSKASDGTYNKPLYVLINNLGYGSIKAYAREGQQLIYRQHIADLNILDDKAVILPTQNQDIDDYYKTQLQKIPEYCREFITQQDFKAPYQMYTALDIHKFPRLGSADWLCYAQKSVVISISEIQVDYKGTNIFYYNEDAGNMHVLHIEIKQHNMTGTARPLYKEVTYQDSPDNPIRHSISNYKEYVLIGNQYSGQSRTPNQSKSFTCGATDGFYPEKRIIVGDCGTFRSDNKLRQTGDIINLRYYPVIPSQSIIQEEGVVWINNTADDGRAATCGFDFSIEDINKGNEKTVIKTFQPEGQKSTFQYQLIRWYTDENKQQHWQQSDWQSISGNMTFTQKRTSNYSGISARVRGYSYTVKCTAKPQIKYDTPWSMQLIKQLPTVKQD